MVIWRKNKIKQPEFYEDYNTKRMVEFVAVKPDEDGGCKFVGGGG